MLVVIIAIFGDFLGVLFAVLRWITSLTESRCLPTYTYIYSYYSLLRRCTCWVYHLLASLSPYLLQFCHGNSGPASPRSTATPGQLCKLTFEFPAFFVHNLRSCYLYSHAFHVQKGFIKHLLQLEV